MISSTECPSWIIRSNLTTSKLPINGNSMIQSIPLNALKRAYFTNNVEIYLSLGRIYSYKNGTKLSRRCCSFRVERANDDDATCAST